MLFVLSDGRLVCLHSNANTNLNRREVAAAVRAGSSGPHGAAVALLDEILWGMLQPIRVTYAVF
jgi:hypothetical protein